MLIRSSVGWNSDQHTETQKGYPCLGTSSVNQCLLHVKRHPPGVVEERMALTSTPRAVPLPFLPGYTALPACLGRDSLGRET